MNARASRERILPSCPDPSLQSQHGRPSLGGRSHCDRAVNESIEIAGRFAEPGEDDATDGEPIARRGPESDRTSSGPGVRTRSSCRATPERNTVSLDVEQSDSIPVPPGRPRAVDGATAGRAGDSDRRRRARLRLLRMHYESGVGHIGGNLSCLDLMLVLHHDVLGPADQFVLSKGHAAGAYYVTLWSLGRLSDDDLRQFHKDGTRLSGHPPTSGIDGHPVRHRQPGARPLAGGRAGPGQAAQGRAGPRLLPDVRRRVERGLVLGGADLRPAPAARQPDDPGGPERAAGIRHDAGSRRPRPAGGEVPGVRRADRRRSTATTATRSGRRLRADGDRPEVDRRPDAQGVRRLVHGRPDGVALPAADGSPVSPGRPGNRASMRNVFCQSLVDAADRPEFVFLTGDLGFMALEPLRDALGDRFINAGVAEQNMVSVARRPGTSRAAALGLQHRAVRLCPAVRADPQRRLPARLPVVLVGNGGGYGYGVMGATHHALEDYGALLCLPHLRAYVPAFDGDVRAMIERLFAVDAPGLPAAGPLRGAGRVSTVPPYAPWRRLMDGRRLGRPGGRAAGRRDLGGRPAARDGPTAVALAAERTARRTDPRGVPGRPGPIATAARGRGARRPGRRRPDVAGAPAGRRAVPPSGSSRGRPWAIVSGRYGSQKFHRRECGLDPESIVRVPHDRGA